MDLSGLPKALREALQTLASEKQVSQLAALIEEHIRTSNADEESVPSAELDLDRPPVMEWSEGVEDYQTKNLSELWAILGFQDQHIPSLRRVQDPTGTHDPWIKENSEWFKDPNNTVPFGPRWHQLVGVIKMLENAFNGLPVLLMDEVGLGKTLQIKSLFATLTYFREYYKVHSRFPGAFGMLSLPSS
jgi:SNF2 family DNA or RNA helicase